jgi:hypothetical protein
MPTSDSRFHGGSGGGTEPLPMLLRPRQLLLPVATPTAQIMVGRAS